MISNTHPKYMFIKHTYQVIQPLIAFHYWPSNLSGNYPLIFPLPEDHNLWNQELKSKQKHLQGKHIKCTHISSETVHEVKSTGKKFKHTQVGIMTRIWNSATRVSTSCHQWHQHCRWHLKLRKLCMLWYHELKYVVAMQRRLYMDLSKELLMTLSNFRSCKLFNAASFKQDKLW